MERRGFVGATLARLVAAVAVLIIVMASAGTAGAQDADTVAPSTPAGVVAETTAAGVAVSWDASSDDGSGVLAYEIWRNGNWYSWVLTPATTYIDTAPVDGARYQIRALDLAFNKSGWSKAAVADTGNDTTLPSTPTALTASPNGGDVDLAWDASSDDGSGIFIYEIWRNNTWYSWTYTNTTTYTDATPVDGATYQLRAIDNAYNASPWTHRVLPEGDDTTAPPTPQNVTAATTSGGVTISWDPVTDDSGILEYEVWRNGNWYSWTPSPNTTYTDIAPTDGATYQIRAIDNAYNFSGWSPPTTDGNTNDDTEPPSEISQPRIIDKAVNGFVTVSWLPATDNIGIDHYELLLVQGSELTPTNGVTFTTTNTTYTINDTPDGTLFGQFGNTIFIVAIDAAGNRTQLPAFSNSYILFFESEDSTGFDRDTDRWLPADGPAPTTEIVDGAVQLTWPRIADNFFIFDTQIYRDGVLVAQPGRNGDGGCAGDDCTFGDATCFGLDCIDGWTDPDATPGETYTYQLLARDFGRNESPNLGEPTTVTVPKP